MDDKLTFLTMSPGVKSRTPGSSFLYDPEFDKQLTKSQLEEKLYQHKGESVHVSYRDRNGKGTTTSLRVLTNFAVEADGQAGVNIVTLYLRGYSSPLFLYQSNVEKPLGKESNLIGKLSAITKPMRPAAAA